ncbi:MAG: hotdog domain-containing protein [Oceanipulchritudo sp.]
MVERLPGHYYFETETYYDQLDGQMILHHPRYFVFVERAQQAWMEWMLGAPRFDWRNFPDMYLVVRRLEAEYLLPVEGVRDVTVILWPERIRAARLEMGFEIRSPEMEILYCQGTRLNCKVNRTTHEPAIWTDAFREAVEKACGSAKEARQQAAPGHDMSS